MVEHLLHSTRGGIGASVKSPERRPIWLISFGDLLTLLWCMILSLICYGHIRPAKMGAQGSSVQTVAQKGTGNPAATAERRSLGTPLAEPSQRQAAAAEEQLFLGARDFAEQQDALSADADARLYGLYAAQRETERTVVTVEACADEHSGEAWFSSVNRALLVRGRLLHAGFRPEQLRLRVLGAQCSAVRSAAGAPADAFTRVVLLASGETGCAADSRSARG